MRVCTSPDASVATTTAASSGWPLGANTEPAIVPRPAEADSGVMLIVPIEMRQMKFVTPPGLHARQSTVIGITCGTKPAAVITMLYSGAFRAGPPIAVKSAGAVAGNVG